MDFEDRGYVLGKRFGRPDTERLGLFAELGYLIGRGGAYTGYIKDTGVRDLKKRQMFPGGSKIKAGLQDCYFDKDFKRVFIGEGINWRDPVQPTSGKYPKAVRNPRSFYPPHVTIKLHYKGDPYGTFSGVIPSMSPRENPKDPYQRQKRGVYCTAGKRGGPGVYDITINKFPDWMECKYDPADPETQEGKVAATGKIKKHFYSPKYPDFFDPNPFKPDVVVSPNLKFIPKEWRKHRSFKSSGGAGDYINKFPEHMPDRYIDPPKREKALAERYKIDLRPRKHSAPFSPPACCRDFETYSILAKNVKISTNERTWKHMKPITFKRRFHKI